MINDLRSDPGRTLAPREFSWLCEFLRDRTGIELKPGKEPMVMARLDRRLRHHGFNEYAQYLGLLGDGDPVETRVAIDLLTTNETRFFREPKHFEFLSALFERRPVRAVPIRIWSAACSSGQEPYTIAMTLAATLPREQDWEVLGTDISGRMLEVAQRGLYPVDTADQIPHHLLRTYCLRGRDEFDGYLAIDRPLRSRVGLRQLNLIDLPEDLGQFDVVFLRNVMIYFGIETKRAVVNRIERHLRPDGHLILSHSESLNGIPSGLRMVTPSVYRNRTDRNRTDRNRDRDRGGDD
jgi:chemotaxis protein methyltransferase CheR